MFNQANGLPANINSWAAFEDKIWAATQDGGVAVFDGKQWTTQKLAEKPLTEFSQTPDRLWVYCDEEQRAFFYENETWAEFFGISQDSYNLRAVAHSGDGQLWFKGWNDVRSFDGQTWMEYPNLKNVSQIFSGSDGVVYFVFYSVVVLYDGQTFRPVVFPGDYYTYTINKFFATSNNELWLTVYDGGTETAYLIHPDGSVDRAPDQLITEQKDEFEQNIYLLNWTPEGLLYFGNNAIALYREESLKTFTLPEQDDEISALIGPYEVIGFAPDGALWLRENKSYSTLIRYDGIDDEVIFSEEEMSGIRFGWVIKINAQGEIWTTDGWATYLSRFKVGEKPVNYDIRFSSIDFDFAPDGTIWLLGNDGYIARIHPEDLNSNRIAVPEYIRIGDGLVENSLGRAERILVAPNGDVWVHVANTGLYRYDGSAWKYMGMYKMDDPTNFAINKSGEIWAGYNNHLFKHDGKGWINYQRNCIFPNHIITAHDDAVWFINGCDGVMRFDEAQWTHYTKDKEMAGVIPNQILTAPDGAIWFISNNAWIRYQP